MKAAGRDPQVVGRYAIYQEIASGGVASVRFARLVGPGGFSRTVAVKVPHQHFAKDREFSLMFLDEARLAARIRHPNVVPILDVVQAEADILLVMEYVHGEALSKLDARAKSLGEAIPLAVSASLITDTLHGLHAAHEATDERGEPLGIVHRDVSPQNILVGVDGVAHLVDFGIAKAAGRLQNTTDAAGGEVKGKYAYMAPEQARGEPVSRVADTFAAAIVFWELVTGEKLFLGRTQAESLHRVLVGRIRPPRAVNPDLPEAIDAVLMKALSRDPAARYQTAREMALDIEACVPPVRRSEVASWVERIAKDALAERAAALVEIERPGKETGVGGFAAERGESDERLESGSRSRWRSRSVRALAIAGAVAFAGLLSVAGVSFRHRAQARSAAAEAPAVDLPPAGAQPTSPAVASAVAAPAVPAASREPPAIPHPTTAPSPSPAGGRDARAITRPGPSAPRTAAPKAARACDPPYSIDSRGREIFKPECM
jgi:serine/threonine-protein kinase